MESNNIESENNSEIKPSDALMITASNVGQALAYTSMKPTFELYSECSNRYNHVSSFPGFGRVICPTCGKIYVRRG